MTDKRTDISFSEAQRQRVAQESVTADAFKACLLATETCVTRTALKLGVHEKSLRKMRAGDMHIPLHDVERLAEHEPALFAAILDRLASLAGKRVVDNSGDSPQSDRLELAASAAKEGGEAIAAIVRAATSTVSDPGLDLHVIREGNEAIAKIGAAVAAAEYRRSKHTEAVARRHAPRGVA